MASHHRNSPILFVGTYTEPEGSKSQGIYVNRMDLMTGQLTFEKVINGIINPSFLDIHPQKNFLYAVNETESFNGQAGGGVSALSIDPTSNELSMLNEQISHGRHPCYISIEQTGRF